MSRGILLLIALLPVAASADTASWLEKGPKAVEIAGATNVPLLRESDSGATLVEVRFPAKELKGKAAKSQPPPRPTLQHWHVGFAGDSFISSAAAEALGLTIKGKEGKADKPQTTVIPEFFIGEARFEDVPMLVIDSDFGMTGAYLSLPQLIGTASAILPSEGVLRLAPASEGAALVAAVGAPTPAERSGAKVVHYHGTKQFVGSAGPLIQGTVGDVNGLVALVPGGPSSAIYTTEISAAAGTRRTIAGYQTVQTTVAVGGVALGAALAGQVSIGGELHPGVIGTLGADFLHSVDIAYDPASSQFGLRAAAEPRWTDLSTHAATRAREEFPLREADDAWKAPDAKPPAEEPAAEGDAPKGDKKAVARHTALAEALWAAGQNTAAIEHYLKAADAAGEDCAPGLRAGRALIQNGDGAKAAEPLARSAELFAKWDKQAPELKKQIDEAESDKDKAKLPEGAYTTKQASECHLAPGLLAEQALATGDHKAVAEIYTAWLDLDATLAHVYGISLWRQGQLEASEGALRRAANMGRVADPHTRLAIAFVSHERGNDAAAQGQIDVLYDRHGDPGFTTAVLTAELLDHVYGRSHTITTLTERVAGLPLSAEAHIVLALALHREGDAAGVAAALKAAEPVLQSAERARAGGASIVATRAVFEALSGRHDDALKALKLAAATDAPNVDGYLAKAIVLSLQGEAGPALEALGELQKRFPSAALPNTWALGPF